MDREEKQAKINQIRSALSNNGIDFDKDFPNIIKRGYGGDGCQELSDKLVEDIYGLVVQGVNDGFANEEVIKDLMDIAVELDDPKKEKKLSKYKGKREDALKNIQRPKVKEGTMDIKSEVLKYIDLAEDTAKSLLQMHLTDMSDQNYNESLELIKELRETVSGVWDNSTVAAMKKAKEVEDCILRWMKCASTMTCSTENVRALRSAVDKAREWGSLNKAAEGRGIFGLGKNKDTARAAEEDIKNQVAYSGKIKIVARAERAVRGVTVLQESLIAAERLLQREKDNFKEVYSTDELEAQIAANNARLDQMFEQFKVMGMRIKNGEAAPGSAEYKKIKRFAADFEQEEKRVKAANYRLKNEIDRVKRMSGGLGRRIEIIESILRELKIYRNQPSVFAEAMDKLGAERLQQFIVGGMSTKEREEFKEGLLALEAWAVEKINAIQDEGEDIDDIREQVDGYIKEDEIKLPEEEDNKQEDRSLESLMDRAFGGGSTPVDQEEETEEDKDRLRYGGSKPFSDDDDM